MMIPDVLSYEFYNTVKSAKTVDQSYQVVSMVTQNWESVYSIVARHARALRELTALDLQFRSEHMLFDESTTYKRERAPHGLVRAYDAFDRSSDTVTQLHRVFVLAQREDLSMLLDTVLSTVPYELHVNVELV